MHILGGTVATNASGAKGFKYGSTRKHILGLYIILSTGQLLDIQRGNCFVKNRLYIPIKNKPLFCALPGYRLPKVKNSVDYYIFSGSDLIDLFIGCEGILGMISKIKVILCELPEQEFNGVVFFKTKMQALEFVFNLKN